jgi:NitT/TauT family transport system permease protein
MPPDNLGSQQNRVVPLRIADEAPQRALATKRPAALLGGALGTQLAVAAVIIVVWYAAVRMFAIPEYLLPSPWTVAVVLVQDYPYLLTHSWVTFVEILVGFAAAVAIGIPLGDPDRVLAADGKGDFPLLVASQSIPKIAIAPLLIFWAGIGMLPKALVAMLIAFFPIVVDTAIGLRSVEIEMLHLARSMGQARRRLFGRSAFPRHCPTSSPASR